MMNENIKLSTNSNKVVVWLTSPLYAKLILEKAVEFSARSDAEVVAVCMQPPIGDDWIQRARDIEIIEKAVRSANAQLRVEFTENQLKTAYDIINNVSPIAMFTGMPAEVSKSSVFIENIRQMAEGKANLYTVDRSGGVLMIE